MAGPGNALKIEEIADALTKAGGFVSHAAELLGVTQPAITRRIQRSTFLQEHQERLKDKKLDLAESKLMKLVNEGNLGAICFYLKCIGKNRGYVERQEITGKDGEAVNHTISVRFVKAGDAGSQDDTDTS